jgi:hypothetical protein
MELSLFVISISKFDLSKIFCHYYFYRTTQDEVELDLIWNFFKQYRILQNLNLKNKWLQRMSRLRKCSRWTGHGHVCRFKLYYKIGETSNIHNRAQVLWTLTQAPSGVINLDISKAFSKLRSSHDQFTQKLPNFFDQIDDAQISALWVVSNLVRHYGDTHIHVQIARTPENTSIPPFPSFRLFGFCRSTSRRDKIGHDGSFWMISRPMNSK